MKFCPFTDNPILFTQVELKSTIEILHEEQERIVKIETIKKSLEVEVKVITDSIHNFNAKGIKNLPFS